MRKTWWFLGVSFGIVFVLLFFLFRKSGCEVKYVTQNGLEELVFGGVLKEVVYGKNSINISIGDNKCVNGGLRMMNSNIPFIVTVDKRDGVNLHRIHSIYTYSELKNLFTQWYGKKVEVYVYNSVVEPDLFPRDAVDSLNKYQKQNWLVFDILRNNSLRESVLGKFVIGFSGLYPVVEIKIYD